MKRIYKVCVLLVLIDLLIYFDNITNYHTDQSGVTTVFHELFHAAGHFQSSPQTGKTFVQAQGIAWMQDQAINPSNGSNNGTQAGTAGQFGETVSSEVYDSMSKILNDI
jgi:hypothetical protein